GGRVLLPVTDMDTGGPESLGSPTHGEIPRSPESAAEGLARPGGVGLVQPIYCLRPPILLDRDRDPGARSSMVSLSRLVDRSSLSGSIYASAPDDDAAVADRGGGNRSDRNVGPCLAPNWMGVPR